MRIPTPDREGEVKLSVVHLVLLEWKRALKTKKHVISRKVNLTLEKTTNVYCKVIFYSENIYILYSGI